VERVTRLQAGLLIRPFAHFLKEWRPLGRLQLSSGTILRDGRFFSWEDWRSPSPEELALLTARDDRTKAMSGAETLDLWLFTIPDRLLRMGRALFPGQSLADPQILPAELPGAEPFLSELLEFLRFIAAPLPGTCAVWIEIDRGRSRPLSDPVEKVAERPAGLHMETAHGPGSPLSPLHFSAIVNVGASPWFLAFVNLTPAQLRMMESPSASTGAKDSSGTVIELGEGFLQSQADYPVTRIRIAPGEGCFAPLGTLLHDRCAAETGEPNVCVVISPDGRQAGPSEDR
jgi:hypothetical protein